MPRSVEKDKLLLHLPARMQEDEREFEAFKQGLRKLVSYHRDKLTKAELALAGLEGRGSATAEPRLNKAIKELLGRKGPLAPEEVRAELLNAGIIVETKMDRARVYRSLKQCVNADTLVEHDGKFALPPTPPAAVTSG
jgi:hypothetical protein